MFNVLKELKETSPKNYHEDEKSYRSAAHSKEKLDKGKNYHRQMNSVFSELQLKIPLVDNELRAPSPAKSTGRPRTPRKQKQKSQEELEEEKAVEHALLLMGQNIKTPQKLPAGGLGRKKSQLGRDHLANKQRLIKSLKKSSKQIKEVDDGSVDSRPQSRT